MTGHKLDSAVLRICDLPESGAVPATVLSRLLVGLQTTVLLLGAQVEQIKVGERFKPKAELREHFQLVVGVPSEGSYVLPLELRDMRGQPSLEGVESRLLDTSYKVLAAVKAGAEDVLRVVLPDSVFRNRVLRELANYVPRAGDDWSFSLTTPDSPEALTLSSDSTRSIGEWLAVTAESTVMSVIGELIRIDFEARKVEIRHPVTSREIACYYNLDVEDTLLEGRHEPIQVTGEFTLDEDNWPKVLTNVTRIEPVDLSPFSIERVALPAGGHLTARQKIQIVPDLDEGTRQSFVADLPDLQLIATGETREDLIEGLLDDLAFLWGEYVEEDEALLDERAVELRQMLLQLFEVGSASGRC